MRAALLLSILLIGGCVQTAEEPPVTLMELLLGIAVTLGGGAVGALLYRALKYDPTKVGRKKDNAGPTRRS